MGRMLDALKALDAQKHAAEVPPEPPLAAQSVSADPLERLLEETSDLVDLAAEPVVVESPPQKSTPQKAPPRTAPQQKSPARPPLPKLPRAPFERCVLPTADVRAAPYLETAARIGSQIGGNYSNVLLLVAADRWAAEAFSMVELAQCFAQQASGDVLLVDGDLREGRLSKAVSRPGVGMVEAMLGAAEWPDIIHPTNVARIDFVARGNGQVPTLERPQFGWGALRPLYRVVLIGLANQAEPETAWLAARCDAVYFVLSRPHTRRAHASAAINALRASGAHVAGCVVVND